MDLDETFTEASDGCSLEPNLTITNQINTKPSLKLLIPNRVSIIRDDNRNTKVHQVKQYLNSKYLFQRICLILTYYIGLHVSINSTILQENRKKRKASLC